MILLPLFGRYDCIEGYVLALNNQREELYHINHWYSVTFSAPSVLSPIAWKPLPGKQISQNVLWQVFGLDYNNMCDSC